MTKSGGLAQIGVHPFDPETGEVRGPCGTTTLRPQTSRVLAVLLAAPGRLVSKDHLMNSVWRAARWIAADIPRAVAAYQRAIAFDPNYVDANMFLANVYIFDGRGAAADRLGVRAQPAAALLVSPGRGHGRPFFWGTMHAPRRR